MITKETRAESFKKLDKQTRYNLILECLEKHQKGLTAREISEELGFVERNATAPRLTELVGLKKVETLSKKYDEKTGVNVAVYTIKKKIDLGHSMKCDNCKYGCVKKERGKIKEVFCGKLTSNMAISYYKQMRVCNLFERGVI